MRRKQKKKAEKRIKEKKGEEIRNEQTLEEREEFEEMSRNDEQGEE